MNEIITLLTNILRVLLRRNGGSVEFNESVTIVGEHGDRAGTKYIYLKNGKIYAHLYNAWMENEEACLEYSRLSVQTLCRLIYELEHKWILSL